MATGGQFLPNNGAFTAQYFVPSAASPITLTLVTEDPAGPCPAVSDEMTLSLLPSPEFSIQSVDCNHDFQSYNVVFSSSANIVNTTPAPATIASATPNDHERESMGELSCARATQPF